MATGRLTHQAPWRGRARTGVRTFTGGGARLSSPVGRASAPGTGEAAPARGGPWRGSPGLTHADERVRVTPLGRRSALERREIVGVQLHRERLQVLLELPQVAGADEHGGNLRARQEPGDRDGGRRRLVPPGDRADRLEHGPAAVVVELLVRVLPGGEARAGRRLLAAPVLP